MNFEKKVKVDSRNVPTGDRKQFLDKLQSNLVNSPKKAFENFNKIIKPESDEK